MSIRPIEMQGSFPQSQKAGEIQEQLQQRGQVSQDIMSEQQKEEELRKRKKVLEADESAKLKYKNEGGERGNPNLESKNSKQDSWQKEGKADHPFKGKFVDFSG